MHKIDDPLRVVAGVLAERPANGFSEEKLLVVHVGEDGCGKEVGIGFVARFELHDDGGAIEPKIVGGDQGFKSWPQGVGVLCDHRA